MLAAPPALKAVSPQAPMGDVGNGDDAYHNGAFFLAANFNFYLSFWPRGPTLREDNEGDPDFDYHTTDHYDFYLRLGPLANAETIAFKHRNPYWSEQLKHPNYDSYWASRALGPVMRHLTAPVLLVGGWFDAEDLGGTLKLFQAIDQHGGAPAVTLVMGPWSHGQWGDNTGNGGSRLGGLRFGSRTSEFFQNQIELPFFRQALKPDPANVVHLPKAWLFETGKNVWRQFDAWPPKNAVPRTLFLEAGGKLSFAPPAGAPDQFDEYVSDPARPVPVTSETGEGMPGDYMTRDQSFASRRPDVLTYETEPLEQDVTLAGPIRPVLRVSTSGTDSDFIVKLIDVSPDDIREAGSKSGMSHHGGYQQLVRGEPFRGKFRNSLSDPQPFVPGAPAAIKFAMPDVLHDFRPGHRIMVQIQSSWFPLVDRNPQRFEDIPTAQARDFQKAVERVYCGGAAGTRIEVLAID
jgi:putative CocE/NonD family hydrolase